jgi:AraC family transcriptional regulator, transcriptional activator of pobA
MDLRHFNVYHYLKEKHAHSMQVPYFLANQDTYKNAAIRFPFRTFTFGIGFTYSGSEGPFRIGSRDFYMQPGTLTTIGPGIVSQWLGEYTSKHDTVYFTEELFHNTLKTSFLKSLSFFLPGGNHGIQVPPENIQKIKALYKSIKQFKDDPAIIPGLIYALLMLTIKCHDAQQGMKQPAISMKEKITLDFKNLLIKHFLEYKDVAFYAAKLNITPKYLSEVLLAETGKTAKALIDEHIFLEAKSLLKQTNMTVQEICHWLGYSDTVYFTKAFKKKENMTPLKYRKS